MKIIEGMIEFEQNEPGSLAAVGDSCAETGRAAVLGLPGPFKFSNFKTAKGFLRHPRCAGVQYWDEADFSNDQLLPLMMATGCKDVGLFRIKGTQTLLSLGAQLIKFGMLKTLARVNAVQSLLNPSPADCLNMAVIAVWLRKQGVSAPLYISNAELMRRIEAYYKPEPNSEQVVAAYRYYFPA